MRYYIASCVFTSWFPELSFRICDFVQEHYDLKAVRCCVSKYKIREFEEKMPEMRSILSVITVIISSKR